MGRGQPKKRLDFGGNPDQVTLRLGLRLDGETARCHYSILRDYGYKAEFDFGYGLIELKRTVGL